MTYIRSVAREIVGRDVIRVGPSDNLLYLSVELLKLVSNFLISCVFSQEEVGVHFGIFAEVLVQVLKGRPIAPAVVESRLIKEVSKVKRVRCGRAVIGIVVAEGL